MLITTIRITRIDEIVRHLFNNRGYASALHRHIFTCSNNEFRSRQNPNSPLTGISENSSNYSPDYFGGASIAENKAVQNILKSAFLSMGTSFDTTIEHLLYDFSNTKYVKFCKAMTLAPEFIQTLLVLTN